MAEPLSRALCEALEKKFPAIWAKHPNDTDLCWPREIDREDPHSPHVLCAGCCPPGAGNGSIWCPRLGDLFAMAQSHWPYSNRRLMLECGVCGYYCGASVIPNQADDSGSLPHGHGDTPEEAVAQLLLSLVKEG